MSGLFKLKWRLGETGRLLAAVLLVLATGVSAGQFSVSAGLNPNSTATNQPPPWFPNGPLTVEQALQRALDYDGQIASLKAAVEVAHEQRLAASDIKDPVLEGESRSGGVGQTTSAADDEWDNSRAAVGVYLPNPWLTVPRVDARTADYQAAHADLNAAIWLVQCEVRRLFAQINFLTNDLAICADRVRLNGEVLNAVQARVGQGAATASDLMTSSRQFIQYQDDFDQSFHRYQMARRELASLLDVSPESFELVADSAAPPAPPETSLSFQQAEALAAKSRCDLAALRWRAQAARYAYDEIRNERIPWLKEVKAGYLDNSQKDTDKYWIGLSMDIPIFSWTKNHAAAAARDRANLANVDVTNGLKLIRQELHDALDELDQTRRQQTRFDTSLSPLVNTMRQTLATLKSTPDILPEQVAAAELQLVETLRYELNTRWQYQLALLNLEQTLGAPLNQ
jgi:outer membrane protein TolC